MCVCVCVCVLYLYLYVHIHIHIIYIHQPARTYTPDGRPEDARTLLTPNVLAGFGRVELAGVLRMSVEDMQLSDCKCLSDNAFFFAVDDVGPTSKQDPATWRRTL